jgi:hypothetical protein
MPKKPFETVQVKIRMRADQHRRIEREAEKNGQTINAEILRRLDQTFLQDSNKETADLLQFIAKAIEIRKDRAKIGDQSDVVLDTIGYGIAGLLTKAFPDFRYVKLSFGDTKDFSLFDPTEGEKKIVYIPRGETPDGDSQ